MQKPSLPPAGERPRMRLCALSIVGSALLLVACSRPEVAQEPVRSVKLITVSAQSLNVQGEYAAEVRARVESRLGFRVGGKLVQRQAEVGQVVQAGQLLALIDAQDYQLAAQAAQAQVGAAQSQRDVAQAEFKRFEALKNQNFISGAELDRRATALQAAQAQLVQAQSQAQAQANQAAYTRLTATASGVVTAVEAEVGQVLAAGQPVLRLAHEGPRDVVFSVSESTRMALKLGQTLRATLTSTGQSVSGKVRELGASADPVTRTYGIKLALDAAVRWPLGATVNVSAADLPGSQSGVIQLPTSALKEEAGQTVVWVLDEASMTVNTQAVLVGAVDGQQVSITSGLKTGQKVVSAGVHVLSPGQKVTVYAPASATMAAPGGATSNPAR
ncbi:efflux RND transporter periplasmic adaptor subunit [Limnohabitans sp.]|uniref:efflux RND transporter periplasmic adaptor subunit n=2 Tax=Limnohabitans sp. TaxID=1907725 RepID=UPI00391B674E